MIPKIPTIALHLLRALADGSQHRVRDLIGELADGFTLTDEERIERLPSGANAIFGNRVWWSVLGLKQAALLTAPQRGAVQITERGKHVLSDPPTVIDRAFLSQFPEFVAQRRKKAEGSDVALSEGNHAASDSVGASAAAPSVAPDAPEDAPPEELLEVAYEAHRRLLESELLEQVREAGHRFFERVVIDVLLAMGYGGSRKDAGRAFQASGDGGVDGVINEDVLGLDRIYVQAKCNKEDNTVQRDRIQAFAGALHGQRATKGVFVTTSSFSRGAIEYAADVGNIALIDGAKLVGLMVDHNVGVSSAGRYELMNRPGIRGGCLV